MAVALVALNAVHPALVLQGPGSDLPPTRLFWWRKKTAKLEGWPLESTEHLTHSNA